MKTIFTEDDFSKRGGINPTTCAEYANEKINKLIESWPVVYWTNNEAYIYREDLRGTTHKARLAFIEEIVKEPCKHEPVFKGFTPLCRYCGVELVSEWKEKRRNELGRF